MARLTETEFPLYVIEGEVWDGTTYIDGIPANLSGLPAVGPGTKNPFGLTIEEIYEMQFRAKILLLSGSMSWSIEGDTPIGVTCSLDWPIVSRAQFDWTYQTDPPADILNTSDALEELHEAGLCVGATYFESLFSLSVETASGSYAPVESMDTENYPGGIVNSFVNVDLSNTGDTGGVFGMSLGSLGVITPVYNGSAFMLKADGKYWPTLEIDLGCGDLGFHTFKAESDAWPEAGSLTFKGQTTPLYFDSPGDGVSFSANFTLGYARYWEHDDGTGPAYNEMTGAYLL